jgi:NAD(P)-dependent dehydrogenase (short-subunit alcohol dehydrogenase family)
VRVLVTGATGPFGRAVCRLLLADGHDVIAMARRKPDHRVADVDFTAGDVRDARAVREAMAECDAVVHLAWVVAPLKTEAETAAINLGPPSPSTSAGLAANALDRRDALVQTLAPEPASSAMSIRPDDGATTGTESEMVRRSSTSAHAEPPTQHASRVSFLGAAAGIDSVVN